jgi:hypothetical protein
MTPSVPILMELSPTRKAPQASTYSYLISGLRVSSEMELPSAIRADESQDEADVTIRIASVPESLSTTDRGGTDWAIQGTHFWAAIPNIMRVLISDGRTIDVQPNPNADTGDCVLYLLGTCFAILLHQRGRVVLHASAVAVGDRAMLFCGVSGAGKSTMAAMLGRRGYPLLNDDVCNLSPQAGGEYAVYPDGRMLKLWGTSLEYLQWTGSPESMVRRDTDKFYMAPERVDLTPRRVGGVYILKTGGDEPAALDRLALAEATVELSENAYRPALVHAMNMAPAYFAASVAIQRHAGVFRLKRPMDFARADEALDLLEQSWADAGA